MNFLNRHRLIDVFIKYLVEINVALVEFPRETKEDCIISLPFL